MGIIMADIDHFKEINDTYGHAAGDEYLIELGKLLQGMLRKEDVLCRVGGDEVILVMPGASLEATKARAENVRKAVKQLQVFYEGEALQKVTLTLGVVVFPDHGKTAKVLLIATDVALYAAKNRGRDRVMSYDEVQPGERIGEIKRERID